MGADRATSGGSWTRKWSLKSLLQSAGSGSWSQPEQAPASSGDLSSSIAYFSEGIAQAQDRQDLEKYQSQEYQLDLPRSRVRSAAHLLGGSWSASHSRSASQERPSSRSHSRSSSQERSPSQPPSRTETPDRCRPSTPEQQPKRHGRGSRSRKVVAADLLDESHSDLPSHRPPPRPRAKDASSILDTPCRSARAGTYEAAALLDTPQQQPVSLLRSARGMFDTGAAPTSAVFPEQTESPAVSRHGSEELRPYVSPFAKPHGPSRQSSQELQMVPARLPGMDRQGSLGMDRPSSMGALQQLPVHTGQSPVRPTPGLMKGSARAQSDFAAMAATEPPQQQPPPQAQLAGSPLRQALPRPDPVGCFGFWASRSKSSPAALDQADQAFPALPAPAEAPRLEYQPWGHEAGDQAHIMPCPPSQLPPLHSGPFEPRTPQQQRHKHSASAASLASEGTAPRRLHSNFGSQSTFERAGSSTSAQSQSPLSDDEGEQGAHDSVTSLRQRRMVAESLSHAELAGFTPEGSPLTKASMVADLWGHGAASPARSSPGKEVDVGAPQWVINPYEIAFCSMPSGKLCRLGSGAFGTVYRGVFKGQPVAVKVCKHSQVEQSALKCFQREVSILYNNSHPNILEFIGACTWRGGQRTVLLTTFMEKGDLYAALGRSPVRYSWHHYGQRIALDVARGLAYLHSRHIVHFDLKSANILLDKDYRAKVADVGLSKTLTQYHNDSLSTYMATSDIGTFSWSAPEVLLGLPCTPKADVYSFGVVLWELATCEIPVGRDMPPIRVPDDGPQELYSLILQCMQHDAARRPDSAELVTLLECMQQPLPRLLQAPRLRH